MGEYKAAPALGLSDEARRWQEDNRKVIEAWNRWDEEHPLLTDKAGWLA